MRRPGPSTAVAVLALTSVHAQERAVTVADAFKSGIELVSVNVTVLDARGQPVQELRPEDFLVEEDGVPRTIALFSAGHVPVSLGIALLLSGFNTRPRLLQDWTGDRRAIMLAADRIVPTGKTSLFDAVADAVPRVQRRPNRKTAVLVVSDGNDNSSATTLELGYVAKWVLPATWCACKTDATLSARCPRLRRRSGGNARRGSNQEELPLVDADRRTSPEANPGCGARQPLAREIRLIGLHAKPL